MFYESAFTIGRASMNMSRPLVDTSLSLPAEYCTSADVAVEFGFLNHGERDWIEEPHVRIDAAVRSNLERQKLIHWRLVRPDGKVRRGKCDGLVVLDHIGIEAQASVRHRTRLVAAMHRTCRQIENHMNILAVEHGFLQRGIIFVYVSRCRDPAWTRENNRGAEREE
jgi:hypothetical protein